MIACNMACAGRTVIATLKFPAAVDSVHPNVCTRQCCSFWNCYARCGNELTFSIIGSSIW